MQTQSADLRDSQELRALRRQSPGVARLLEGKRVAMVMFSDYPADPRPRRAIDALVEQGMKVDLICLGENSRFEHSSSGDVEVLRLPISHRRGGKLLYV